MPKKVSNITYLYTPSQSFNAGGKCGSAIRIKQHALRKITVPTAVAIRFGGCKP